ncbi:hypothetical protein D3C80_587700 [compost metagenome]
MPQGDESLLFRRHDVRFHFEKVFRHEVFDIFVPPYHQPQYWRLHPSNGQHAVITGIAPQNGVGTGHVDAIQPISAGTRQGRYTQRDKIAVITQPLYGTFHRLRVEIVDQATAYAVPFFRRQRQIVEHFVHQQLAFAIRVTCVHHLIGFMQQFFDRIKLLAHRRARLQLPLLWDDWQVRQRPARIAAVVGIRLRLL